VFGYEFNELLNKKLLVPIVTSLATCLSADENYNKLVVAAIYEVPSNEVIY
jgi:hypothetical protein